MKTYTEQDVKSIIQQAYTHQRRIDFGIAYMVICIVLLIFWGLKIKRFYLKNKI